MRAIALLIATILSLSSVSAAAHEVWLEPLEWRVAPGGTIAADLRNGEVFSGARYSYNPRNFLRFEQVHDGVATPVAGRLGDRPAARIPDAAPGLHVLVYVATSSRLKYRAWEKFAAFAAHKDFPDIEARHRARGLPRQDFWEAYSRFAKTLVAVGDGAGADAALGLEAELVALDNPYAGAPETVRVRALYKAAPRADAQVEVYERAPNGAVTVTLHRTNAQGIATLPVKPGHAYLVDAVVLRIPEPTFDPFAEAVWETLWATLTFAVGP